MTDMCEQLAEGRYRYLAAVERLEVKLTTSRVTSHYITHAKHDCCMYVQLTVMTSYRLNVRQGADTTSNSI